MPRRILFADDSMTAQNMGKKILTDAGYEVIAVSNGAAAVKKIAEQKPDMIILDIFMPGYSGLEVCEKVRASFETMKTPVLLTVGKMEPYSPGDANRVKADGVIVKPFEASDLLAIIKKFEERISPPSSAPQAEPTTRPERPSEARSPDAREFAVAPAPAPIAAMREAASPAHPRPPADAYLDENTVQATVDVPDHMATSSAFSDLLGTSEPAAEQFPAPPPVPVSVIPETTFPEPTFPEPTFEDPPDLSPATSFTTIPEPQTPLPAPSMASSAEISLETSAAFIEAETPTEFGSLPESIVPEAMTPGTMEPETMVPETGVSETSGPEFVSFEPAELAVPEIAANVETAPATPEIPRPRARDTQPIPIYEFPQPSAKPPVQPEAPLEAGAQSFEQEFLEEELPVQPVSLHSQPEPIAPEPVTYELERPSPAGEISIARDPEFEVSGMGTAATAPDLPIEGDPQLESGFQYAPQAAKPAEPATFMDPNLVTGQNSMESFTTQFGVENPEEMPVGIATESPESAPDAAASLSDDDFEARVAAAMAAYEQSADGAESFQEVTVEEANVEIVSEADALETPELETPEWEHSLAQREIAEEMAPASVPSFEYVPPVDRPPSAASVREAAYDATDASMTVRPAVAVVAPMPAPVEFPAAAFPPAARNHQANAPLPFPARKEAERETAASDPEAVNAGVEAGLASELPAVVEATVSAVPTDGERIAQAVHRVMERLKPELIAEIVRELNSTK